MISIKKLLSERLIQSKNRKFLIQRYIDHPEMGLGGRQYTNVDIEKINEDIDQCNVALDAINKFKKETGSAAH